MPKSQMTYEKLKNSEMMDAWNSLVTNVTSFCEARNIDFLDINARSLQHNWAKATIFGPPFV
jgi:hypothetical protein